MVKRKKSINGKDLRRKSKKFSNEDKVYKPFILENKKQNKKLDYFS